MTDRLTLALAQINPIVGDVAGNAVRIRDAREEASHSGADLVIFGELAITGYPPEDLVIKHSFMDHVDEVVAALAKETDDGGPGLLLGAPWAENGRLYNAALLLDKGAIAAIVSKHDLPNYSVFDEKRIFAPGPLPEPMDFRGRLLGVLVCEDMWSPAPPAHLRAAGAEILVVLNGSPFEQGKRATRRELAANRVSETHLPLVYVNQVGGQDELVFDGACFVLDGEGELRHQASYWRENVSFTEWEKGEQGWSCAQNSCAESEDPLADIYQALMLGLRDYVEKNGFSSVLVGLSGGVDSALSTAIAADALGADKVHCVMMPSPYTSIESLEDAGIIAEMLGVCLDEITIAPAMDSFAVMLEGAFEGRAADTTEENIQARSRGITLMALSNKFGHMVLSTGNKSEMSVGYATLYGDLCGGFSVLKDVYKTTVFALSRYRNGGRPANAKGPDGPIMPERVITKPPSAELKPDQTDQDSLPAYEELDAILKGLVEKDLGVEVVTAQGHERATVERIWSMLLGAEYKRRQAPPGVRVSPRAFGSDRRYPITNRFEDGR
jgi:NAD+ synthase